MDSAIHTALAGWANFYLITGTAAAALTGLQFVVQTLLASNGRPVGGDDPEAGINAFATPTIVHFSSALIISAMLCAPWTGFGSLRATLGVLAAGALVYIGIVMRRAGRQRNYVTTTYDWVFYVLFPGGAYATVLLAAMFLDRAGATPLAAVGAATLLLLCVGIHNAWDTVTWLTIHALRSSAPERAPDPPRQKDSKPRGHRRR